MLSFPAIMLQSVLSGYLREASALLLPIMADPQINNHKNISKVITAMTVLQKILLLE